MSKLLKLLVASFAGVVFSFPALAESGTNIANDTMSCSIAVEYLRNNAVRLTYAKDFEVSPVAPYSDDFSNAIRFRFFDAKVERVNGVPEVSVIFDADVDVFNAVDFGTTLKVKDESNGETLSGNTSFFTSVPGAAGSHRTNYTLTCKRAKL